MSSRNGYLSPNERSIAPALNRLLQAMCRQLLGGRTDYATLEAEGEAQLRAAGFESDYLSIRQQDLKIPLEGAKKLVILAAARLGTTRLIDNCPLDLG